MWNKLVGSMGISRTGLQGKEVKIEGKNGTIR